ncbi:MAG: hypothetical protein Q7S03_00310 [bacterium]|nr:hypothetical protein [bacterium]
MKKTLLVSLFLTLAPLTLYLSLYSLHKISSEKTKDYFSPQPGVILGTSIPLELYSAQPPFVGSVNHDVIMGDARPLIIKQYLERYRSPMADYADSIFGASEKWGIDYRLIVAIAQCESNLCKKIPEGSYNCWGFGNGQTRFESWDQAFNSVAKTLRKKYIDLGLTTPQLIMPKYVPPSVEKGGPWAKCVDQYLEELQ